MTSVSLWIWCGLTAVWRGRLSGLSELRRRSPWNNTNTRHNSCSRTRTWSRDELVSPPDVASHNNRRMQHTASILCHLTVHTNRNHNHIASFLLALPVLIRPPVYGSNGRSYKMLVMFSFFLSFFFFFATRSPSSLDRSPWNFATWSESACIL